MEGDILKVLGSYRKAPGKFDFVRRILRRMLRILSRPRDAGAAEDDPLVSRNSLGHTGSQSRLIWRWIPVQVTGFEPIRLNAGWLARRDALSQLSRVSNPIIFQGLPKFSAQMQASGVYFDLGLLWA